MIELKNISKDFGSGEKAVHAVRDVSLSIGSGEIFGIIGFSGAGKSTLVRCINLLERPSSGSVFVAGQDLTALSAKDLRAARKKIGMIFQHFGHTAQFKLYDVSDGKIVRAEVVDTNGSGHGALASFLMQRGVDTLICGGIGGGAPAALAEAGIKLYGGVSGEADTAVAALLVGNLGYDPNVHCDHHDHEHGKGGHSCGDHGCGHHSCH